MQTLQLFYVEVEKRVYQRLETIATREGININAFASALLRDALLLHRSQVQDVIDTIKRNHKCRVF